jgi:hypothetical protein
MGESEMSFGDLLSSAAIGNLFQNCLQILGVLFVLGFCHYIRKQNTEMKKMIKEVKEVLENGEKEKKGNEVVKMLLNEFTDNMEKKLKNVENATELMEKGEFLHSKIGPIRLSHKIVPKIVPKNCPKKLSPKIVPKNCL